MMVDVVGVVKVEARRVDASGLDSTRVLSDKSDVEVFFQKMSSNICILMYHAMMKCDNHTIS